MSKSLKKIPLKLRHLDEGFKTFRHASPFNYCVIDDFLSPDWLAEIEKEFLPFDSPKWYVYKNAIEDKKALNNWETFPPTTYKFFSYLNSKTFIARLSKLVGTPLFPDNGLNGGGWHIHGSGGNLNPHLDYSIHPKLGLQRKVNIIIYVASDLKEEHGGHLGLWENDPATMRPGKMIHEVAPKFNRAVIFDTTQNSWHGMSRPLTQPEGIYRKSLAIYYLCTPPANVDPRSRALFAPREEQKGIEAIEELIRLRSDVKKSEQVYRIKENQ